MCFVFNWKHLHLNNPQNEEYTYNIHLQKLGMK